MDVCTWLSSIRRWSYCQIGYRRLVLHFMCWADFDGRFLAPIDKYDVAGVAVTRGGREECIGGLIMPIEAEIR